MYLKIGEGHCKIKDIRYFGMAVAQVLSGRGMVVSMDDV